MVDTKEKRYLYVNVFISAYSKSLNEMSYLRILNKNSKHFKDSWLTWQRVGHTHQKSGTLAATRGSEVLAFVGFVGLVNRGGRKRSP
jgi:hypothetical protein